MKRKLTVIVSVPVVLETWFKNQPKYLSKYYDIDIITSYSDNLKSIEEAEGVKITCVDLTRQITPFKDLKTIWKIFTHLKKNQTQLVYTLTPKAGLLGMIAAWMARVPLRIHNVVGLPHLASKTFKKNILILTERITYHFATNIYSNSLNLVEEIKKLTHKQVKVIGHGSVNGVDITYFNDDFTQEQKELIRKQYKIDSNGFIMIFIGRIVKDKGINELVKVFEKIYSKFPQVKLLLIGDFEHKLDPVDTKVEQLIEDHPAIIKADFCSDIRPFLGISDLFILPSYREGLPNVLIEAGSFGIPLLATNINGCNEIIIEGENGVLVNARDESSLNNGIETLINDKEYYTKLKKNVRESIIQRYSQDYFYQKLYEEFQRLEECIK